MCLEFGKKEYWRDRRSRIHFWSRIVPLNKDYPRVPRVTRYRPIVITSYVIKLLELLIMEKLNEFTIKHGVRNQYGFVPRLSIA